MAEFMNLVTTVLDRMRETQIQHGNLLLDLSQATSSLAERQSEMAEKQDEIIDTLNSLKKQRSVTPLLIWQEYLQPLGRMAVWWAPALFLLQHIARGGDLAAFFAKASSLH